MMRILAVLTFVALAACTRSPVPITTPAGNQPDDALLGQWQNTLEGKTESIFIKSGNNGELIVTGETPEDGTRAEDFHVIVARLGRQRYASGYMVAPPGEQAYPATYWLMRYEWRDTDHFAVYGADDELVMDAINRKLIAGGAYDDRHTPGIELSAGTEDLRAFIKAHGARIFTDGPPVEFTRVKQQAAPAETTPPRP